MLFTTPFDAYLLTVRPPCNDLNFAQAIGLTSTGNTVSARLDSVTVKNMRCPIAEIRKVDYQRMQADMRAEAAKAKAGAPHPAMISAHASLARTRAYCRNTIDEV